MVLYAAYKKRETIAFFRGSTFPHGWQLPVPSARQTDKRCQIHGTIILSNILLHPTSCAAIAFSFTLHFQLFMMLDTADAIICVALRKASSVAMNEVLQNTTDENLKVGQHKKKKTGPKSYNS